MSEKKITKYIDFYLLFLVFTLFVIGLLLIASATNAHQLGITREVKVQAIGFFIGLVAMVVVMLIDYEIFGDFYKVIYALSIIVLLLVYVPGLGVVRGGANSWINLGPIDLQTSELAKIGFIISFGKFLENREGKVRGILDLIGPVLFLAPILLLVFVQPDLGSAIVFVVIFVGMIFVAGINFRVIFAGILATIISIPFAYNFMEPHQKQRIDAFLNPNDHTLKGNYQVLQSKITIGSGQVFGRGLFQGVYHRYDYLPVQETDFIFAVAGEELGFVGCSIIIFLYFLFLSRLLTLSFMSKDRFGTYIIIGVLSMFAYQIFQNIGMTIGVMPVTGVTLPFLSYGGSSIITSMIAIGLVLNVYLRRKKKGFMS